MQEYKKKQVICKCLKCKTTNLHLMPLEDIDEMQKVLKEKEQQAYHKLFIQFLKLWSKETVAYEEMEQLGKKFGLDVKYHKASKIKARWEVKG